MPYTHRLTSPQKNFLRSYIPDVDQDVVNATRRAISGPLDLSRGAEIAIARRRFVATVAGTHFDGPDYSNHARIAQKLHAKGLLDQVDRHANGGLGIRFTPAGAEALFDLLVNESHSDRHALPDLPTGFEYELCPHDPDTIYIKLGQRGAITVSWKFRTYALGFTIPRPDSPGLLPAGIGKRSGPGWRASLVADATQALRQAVGRSL